MSSPSTRLKSVLGHLWSKSSSSPHSPETHQHTHHLHTLSPTSFLPRAAAIEPHAEAIVHITANGAVLRRSYQEFADRARGLAYYLKTHGYKRVGVLMTNTPAFLEAIFGVVAAGAVIVPANYRLKEDDITYIFDYAEVDLILVDLEFEALLGPFTKTHTSVKIVVDTVGFKPHCSWILPC